MELVGEATRRAEMAHCGYVVQEMVDMAWLETETRRLVNELMEVDERVQIEVERRVQVIRLENKSLERVEKLEKASRKKKAFITINISKSITMDLVDKAVETSEESHCANIVLEMVEMAWLEVETGRLTVSMETGVDVLKPGTVVDMDMDQEGDTVQEEMNIDLTKMERFSNI